MKRITVLVLVLTIMMSMNSAFAGDLGVQVIGGDSAAMDVVSLDDMQLGERYTIDGYATVIPVFFGYVDSFAEYMKDRAGDKSKTVGWWQDADGTAFQGYDDRGDNIRDYVLDGPFEIKPNSPYNSKALYYSNLIWNDSGEMADYMWFRMDLVNRRKDACLFSEETIIKVVYDDEFEFAGWLRQINPDYVVAPFRSAYEGVFAEEQTINPANEESVEMMYTGCYAFGCTLPTEVINGKEPLRVEIQLGDNELTYHIRK